MSAPSPPPSDVSTLIARLTESDELTTEQLDELPFGAIGVDSSGVIFAYNAAEARLAELSADSVIGRNFFTDVAPCTNVEGFADRFHRGMTMGRFNIVFPFTFRFPSRATNVWVTIFYAGEADEAWIFVEKRDASER